MPCAATTTWRADIGGITRGCVVPAILCDVVVRITCRVATVILGNNTLLLYIHIVVIYYLIKLYCYVTRIYKDRDGYLL